MAVYLLHFDRPYKHAQHYIGYAADVEARIARHKRGYGANLVKVCMKAGIGFTVVRVWEGDRSLERRLKSRHNSRRLCPICRPDKAFDALLKAMDQVPAAGGQVLS